MFSHLTQTISLIRFCAGGRFTPFTGRAGGTANRVGGDQCLTQARALGGFGMNHHLRRSVVFVIVRAMPELEAYFGAAANLFDAQGKLTNESTCDFSESFAASIEAIGSGQIDELEEAMAQMASFLATLAWLQGTAGRVMKLVP